MIDLNKEMAWITFRGDGWGNKWFPVTSITGEQLEWSDSNHIMNLCREKFNNRDNSGWVYFGIAPTSQMVLNNPVRDNF